MRLALALAFCAFAQVAAAAEVAGARFDPRAVVGGEEIVLNGAGLRRILLFKAYAIGLYLPRPTDTVEKVLADRGAKRLRIVLMRTLGADKLAHTIDTGLHRNLTDAEFEPLAQRVESLRAAIYAFGEAKAGAVIHLDWLPAAGVTRLTVDGESRSGDFPGADFYNALLKVWLGSNVNDPTLRDKLLGREDD